MLIKEILTNTIKIQWSEYKSIRENPDYYGYGKFILSWISSNNPNTEDIDKNSVLF